jgi:heme a synthase
MLVLFERHRSAAHKPWLARFCIVALLWATCLLYAGGFTTSIQAGMAFLDWPLSNGSINPDGWLTEPDKRAEHSHRLLGATVGMLTLTIAVWVHLRERRRWMRRLGWTAAALVVAQGALGGARVLFDRLNTGADHNLVAQVFAIAHGCTAQVFLCALVAIAVASTRLWIERAGGLQRAASPALRRAGLLACGALFVQLLLGAVMRHSHAGLAIPTFPLTAEGSLLPSAWDFRVGVHFAHRAWALVVLVALMYFAGRLWAARGAGRVLGVSALALTLGLALQIQLGALVIWTTRNPHAATLHMLGGAFLLAVCWGATLVAHRHRFPDPLTPETEGISAPLAAGPDPIRA